MKKLSKKSVAVAIVGFSFAFGFAISKSSALAPTCEELFRSESVVRDTAVRRTIDLKTKQVRDEGFVTIASGASGAPERKLYVDYLRPAPGKPQIVLINGLTYRTGIWDEFVNALKGEGLGILRYDPVGMGKTMELYGPPKGPVSITEQVHDLKALLDALGIHEKVHVLGLSYGGGVAIEFTATYPSSVETLIPMAAYTAPLPGQVKQIMSWIAFTRTWQPWMDRYSDSELYSMYLKKLIYFTFPLPPPIGEPIVLEHPYKLESVYRLAEGATPFNAEFFLDKLPAGVLHQVDARRDQYITADISQAFWDKIPEKVRASRMIIDMSEHKIPEAYPDFSAHWVKLIIAKDPRIQDGTTWNGTGLLGQAYSGSRRIKVN